MNMELTVNDNSGRTMAEMMGVDTSAGPQKASSLARLNILHTALMGEVEVAGKLRNTEVLPVGTFSLKIDEDIIFISGDVFLKKETCRNFIQNPNLNSILIDNNPRYFVDEDPVKVTIENNRITAIDKKLSLFQTKGVAPGLYRMSHEVFQEFFNIAEYLIEKGFVNYGYIEPIKILIKKYNFIPHFIGKESWFDIDTIEEYKTIKREIDNLEDRSNKDEI